MRAVLEFLSGARKGHKVDLPAGRSVSVGRTSWSELVCEDDGRMSKVHFYLKTDPLGCYLQDHKSRNGSFVNGVRVDKCILRDGDTIQAGDTSFRVTIEGDDPIAASTLHQTTWVRTDVPLDEQQASKGRLKVPFTVEPCETGLTLCRGGIEAISPGTLAKLLADTYPLHMIVHFNRLGIPFPEEFGQPQYLFDWMDPAAAAMASPVVVSPGEGENWRVLVNDSWGQDAVICFFSQKPPAEVLSHLRSQCRVRGGNGPPQQGMFGYCWPGVLASVLTQSPRNIVGRLMANIDAVLVEFPDLPDNWQLFGNERLPNVLEKFGFVRSAGSAVAAESRTAADTAPPRAKFKTVPPESPPKAR